MWDREGDKKGWDRKNSWVVEKSRNLWCHSVSLITEIIEVLTTVGHFGNYTGPSLYKTQNLLFNGETALHKTKLLHSLLVISSMENRKDQECMMMSLMTTDAEHLFICLWALSSVLLGEVSDQVFCPFFNWVVCLPGVESCEFFIYFGDQTLVQDIIGKYVFPYSWFSFHFNAVFFSHAEWKLKFLIPRNICAAATLFKKFIHFRERESPTSYSTYLCIHWLTLLCSPIRDGGIWVRTP